MSLRSIVDFRKAYKLQIPYEPEFWYYINLLCRSVEFENLPRQLMWWKQFEADVPNNESIRKVRLRYMQHLIDTLKNSGAYHQMHVAPHQKGESQQRLKVDHMGRILMSVDLVCANYSILRTFDSGDLPESWEALCRRENIPLALANSKSFRQIVFGNLNPKRSQQFQLKTIHQIMKMLGELLTNDMIMFVSPDEFIIDIGTSPELPSSIQNIMQNLDRWNTDPSRPQIKRTFFQLDPIPNEKPDCRIKTHFELIDNQLVKTYQSLFGVPGNRFFLNFKEHILREPLEKRDRYFMAEDRLACWV